MPVARSPPAKRLANPESAALVPGFAAMCFVAAPVDVAPAVAAAAVGLAGFAAYDGSALAAGARRMRPG